MRNLGQNRILGILTDTLFLSTCFPNIFPCMCAAPMQTHASFSHVLLYKSIAKCMDSVPIHSEKQAGLGFFKKLSSPKIQQAWGCHSSLFV